MLCVSLFSTLCNGVNLTKCKIVSICTQGSGIWTHPWLIHMTRYFAVTLFNPHQLFSSASNFVIGLIINFSPSNSLSFSIRHSLEKQTFFNSVINTPLKHHSINHLQFVACSMPKFIVLAKTLYRTLSSIALMLRPLDRCIGLAKTPVCH